MTEIFETSDPTIFGTTSSATSSPGSEAGPLPCDSLDGPMTSPVGQAPVHANLSARQAKEQGLLTSGTYGPPSTTSFKSAVLQESLASKLRQRLDVNGSLEFALTWKSWDIDWGAPICALRARARPISDSESTLSLTGWKSPKATEGMGRYSQFRGKQYPGLWMQADSAMPPGGWPSPMAGSPATATYNEAGNNDSSRKTVALVAGPVIAGWPTPVANDDNKTPEAHLRMKQRMGERDGSNANRTQITSLQVMAQTVAGWGTLSPSEMERDPMVLHNQVHLVGWGTPSATERSGQGERNVSLMQQARLAGPRPTDDNRNLALDAFGVTTSSSPAGTEKRGVLNPAFSCWLMGFPAGWENYADSATP